MATHAAERPLTFALSPAIAVPAAFAVAVVGVGAIHAHFTEFDGLMQLASGRTLLAHGVYTGWASHFWPPLYALLTAIGSHMTSGFWAGKAISIVAAVSLVAVAGSLTMRLTGSRAAAIAVQVLLAVNPLFFVNAFEAQNHMLDAALFVTTIRLLVAAADRATARAFAIAGAVAGFAFLARYTSGVLAVAAVIAALASAGWSRRAVAAVLSFGAAMLIVASPWLIQNELRNGSPLASWQYLNIGSAFIDTRFGRWWWLTQSSYHGYRSVVLDHLGPFLRNVGRNVWGALGQLFGSAGAAAAVIAPGVAWAPRTLGKRNAWILLGTTVAFLLVIVQAFLRDYLFLPVAVILTIAGVAFTGRFLKGRWFAAAVAALSVAGAVATGVHAVSFLRQFNSGSSSDVDAVARVLRADPDIARRRVMAIHPIYAYEAGSEFVMTPLYFGSSVDAYVRLALTKPVRAYVPRIPADLPDANLSADYLVVNKGLIAYLPQFRSLLDPVTRGVLPAGFTVVYDHRGVTVVYRVTGTDAGETPTSAR